MCVYVQLVLLCSMMYMLLSGSHCKYVCADACLCMKVGLCVWSIHLSLQAVPPSRCIAFPNTQIRCSWWNSFRSQRARDACAVYYWLPRPWVSHQSLPLFFAVSSFILPCVFSPFKFTCSLSPFFLPLFLSCLLLGGWKPTALRHCLSFIFIF